MEYNLQDKVSIVTGGSSGIGKVTALALAEEGSKVVVADVNFEQANKVTGEIRALGQEAVAMKVDVTNKSEVQDMIDQILEKFKRIDILVNCAGILPFSSIEELSEKDWKDILDVNLTGTFFCSQAVIKGMKKQKSGKIVNIS